MFCNYLDTSHLTTRWASLFNQFLIIKKIYLLSSCLVRKKLATQLAFLKCSVYIDLYNSLDSYGCLLKSNEMFRLHCLQGERARYEIKFLSNIPKQYKYKTKISVAKFSHRNFSPTRTAIKSQFRQRHLSSF